jgi:hypothetical protein
MTIGELMVVLAQYDPDKRVVMAMDREEKDYAGYGGTIYDDPAVGITEGGIVYITFEYDVTAIHGRTIDSDQ